jgi:hypothetical protein
MKLNKLRHYHELRTLRATNPKVAELWANIASQNLGGNSKDNFEQSIRWLDTNAMETDEAGVTDEVNGVRDIVEDKLKKMLGE